MLSLKVLRFQFPSSGKVHPNMITQPIPVNREMGFNSLQAGKSIQTCYHRPVRVLLRTGFNSLQAGKSIQT